MNEWFNLDMNEMSMDVNDHESTWLRIWMNDDLWFEWLNLEYKWMMKVNDLECEWRMNHNLNMKLNKQLNDFNMVISYHSGT